ncbi:sigma factor-like helix-turn-helix DNA-binding protein [Demequina soli]|uniref:sigma factor-like helix-turn-helix DNA-binding protein n=1 Tax=Demequina soli TaxID=1638987 RepID=UPI0007854278|nr:sigma factor-like helix-turn-helix DNA-binding protein [Demequina soli]
MTIETQATSWGVDFTPTWIDIFPWVDAIPLRVWRSPADDAAWNGITNEPAAAGSARHLELVAVIGDFLQLWTLEELFPSLTGEDFAVALREAAGIATLPYPFEEDPGALENVDSSEMANLLGGAVRTVDRALELLIERAVLTALSGEGEAVAVVAPDQAHQEVEFPDVMPAAIDDVVADIRTVVEFQAAMGRNDGKVLARDNFFDLPEGVAAAFGRLHALRTIDLLSLLDAVPSPAERLGDLVSGESDMARAALIERLFADSPRTLDSLGEDFGVTRERIRQVSAKARARLEREIRDDALLSEVNEGIVKAIGDLLPLADLLREYPALDDLVPGIGMPVWRVLDRLDDRYEIEEGWCASPSLAQAEARMRSLAKDLADAHGVVRLADLRPAMPASFGSDRAEGEIFDWFVRCGAEVIAEHLVFGVRSIVDRSAAVLSVEGAPLTSEVILEKTGQDRSLRSLKNGLGSDQRFMRVDRDEWALVEWDLEAYDNIRGLIGRVLDEHDGVLELDELVASICAKYSVAPNSVVAYASAPPYVNEGGMVRRAGTVGPDSLKSPERTKRVYRVGEAWLFRSVVNDDHVRGSGTALLPGIASALGLGYGESRDFDGVAGMVAVRWTGLQPSLGTVRRELAATDLRLGDDFFVVFHDSGALELRAVAGRDVEPLTRLRGLVGLEPHAGDDLSDVAAAMGCPSGTGLRELLNWSSMRGDHDVTAVLELLIARSARVDDEPSGHASPGDAADALGADALGELLALQRDFRAAQRVGQFALAEQIQTVYGPKLREFMRTSGMDLGTLLGLLEAAGNTPESPAVD